MKGSEEKMIMSTLVERFEAVVRENEQYKKKIEELSEKVNTLRGHLLSLQLEYDLLQSNFDSTPKE